MFEHPNGIHLDLYSHLEEPDEDMVTKVSLKSKMIDSLF